MWHAWEWGETCTGFLVGKPEGRKPLEDQDIDWRMG
jgi:hypothetical protein